VQAYYKSAPYFARFLLRYTDFIAPVRRVVLAFYWLLFHPAAAAAGVGVVFGLGWLYRRHRRAAIAAAMALGVVALSSGVGAQVVYMTNQQMVDKADLVVRGTIATENARWSGGGRIYTDHTFTVSDVIKGPAAPPAEDEGEKAEDPAPHVSDGNTISFTVIGGTIGTVVMKASPIPTFDVGDEVVLFFIWKREQWVVFSGERGEVDVVDENGKQYVVGNSASASLGLLEASKQTPNAIKPGNEEFESVKIPVEDYLAYLRSLVRD
jgi:hypothetical protein